MDETIKAQLERELDQMEAMAEEYDRRLDAYERTAVELRAELYGQEEDDA